jgi:hypothetical protein
MAFGRTSEYLTQYLNTATDGNVTVEYAADVDRYRLYCKSCRQTLTYGDVVPLPTMYEKYGTLDDSIQQFARFHRHKPRANEPTTGVDPATGLSRAWAGYCHPAPRSTTKSKQAAIVLRNITGRKFKP